MTPADILFYLGCLCAVVAAGLAVTAGVRL
jgi:hypothetical protein